ncbi:hypothetical protein TraAM80_01279 [Trypanosoma rangeli]|uniref:Uncharacterized protein n=1 Tax=Trypanosoma rangeli TaxID=5698 RepID=A0A3R7NSF0_TRYRA|nr:uncharacterized protein TraAM80_01279 [Trypanosoma rangeli]RNF10895.1 hypothetical protein TraAM80_01279 [Trypanosoma rangeli]|eukprot:RNF10895.1 hypothetical protein TraAM80_01279 [Trypanosoma rangeli]
MPEVADDRRQQQHQRWVAVGKLHGSACSCLWVQRKYVACRQCAHKPSTNAFSCGEGVWSHLYVLIASSTVGGAAASSLPWRKRRSTQSLLGEAYRHTARVPRIDAAMDAMRHPTGDGGGATTTSRRGSGAHYRPPF